MREYLFRGKRKDNDKWEEGYLLKDFDKRTFILPLGFQMKFGIEQALCFEVIPETIGQFATLPDKNGNKIFEGDLLKERNDFRNEDIIHKVVQWKGCFQLEDIRDLEKEDVDANAVYLHDYYLAIEIIGNIYDNPELLTTTTNT